MAAKPSAGRSLSQATRSSELKESRAMSQKRFSRRSFALPAALILFVILIVAGATITLHHRDRNPSVPRALAAEKSVRSSTRKMLRLRAERTEGRRFRHHQSGGEALPRGIVHDSSNLEMVPMAGDPAEKDDAGRPPKSLLAIPVGIKNKAAVDKLVSKFPADRFAVMLFHYDGAVEQWSDLEWSARAVHVAAPGQTKLWFAKRFLHPDVVAEYDYVFLWDEDVEVDNFDPVAYLEIVRREGLEVSQPALDRRSEVHHGITVRALRPVDAVHRRFYRAAAGGGGCDGESEGPPCTGWVEVMVPVFSRAAWRCAWRMVQNDLVHGWGLDYKLGYCAQGHRTLKVGVVDTQYVLHRGVPTLGGGDSKAAGRIAVRRRAFDEMRMFDRRWKEAVAEDGSWTDPYAKPAIA